MPTRKINVRSRSGVHGQVSWDQNFSLSIPGQGEDRWLCTLLLLTGGRIEFEAGSHCQTFAPEDLSTFFKQRRRWGPSTLMNLYEAITKVDLERDFIYDAKYSRTGTFWDPFTPGTPGPGGPWSGKVLRKAVNTNRYITRFYIFYQALILSLSFISIAVTAMSLWEALDLAMSDSLSTIYTGVIIILPIIFFIFICFKYESNTQLFWAFIFR